MSLSDDYFGSFEEWHEAVAYRCGIKLTPDYCSKRVEALRNLKDPSTKQFINLFGERYRDTVIGWFERAGAMG